MKQRQLFFDLDRTLWDFEKNSKKTLQELFSELHLKTLFEHFEQFHYHYKRINSSLWEKYGKGKINKESLRTDRFSQTLKHGYQHTGKYNANEHQYLSEQLSEEYVIRSPRQTSLFPECIETLTYLKSEGYKMHICTNGFEEVQHIKLENSGLISFFDVILCSEHVGASKPSAAFFKEAMLRSKCKPEHAIMIGDDFKADIHGALNAGWRAIHFDPEHKFKNDGSISRVRSLNELPYLIATIL
jgi:putative hydrolase of the HAD superfamily